MEQHVPTVSRVTRDEPRNRPPVSAIDRAALYRSYVTPLYRYFYHVLTNVHDAEDLTATTVSKALLSLEGYRGEGEIGAWLFSIARHTLRDVQRRQRPSLDVTVLTPPPMDPSPSPEAQLLQAEQAALRHHLIRQLPDDQRETIRLRYFGALRTAAIAAVLHRSEGATRLLIHRGLTALRQQYFMEEQG